MPKIRDLIEFEEIKDVIDIDEDLKTTDNKKNIIRDYIISDGLKAHIKSIINNLSRPNHKSIQIIGGYGSGKSHLLAWLVSLLENTELAEEIQDPDIKNEALSKINRKFAVVQFELQPGEASLSEFFFDRIQLQLDEKHGIQIPDYNQKKAPDYKKDIEDILKRIQNKKKMGLIVIIDEISDFLKQKSRQQINKDIQFLRILGQVSQAIDFMMIGSMQENVFSNPKYIDEAESFGRVSQRFDIVTITREDIEKVISNRVLKKTLAQKKELDDLLTDYKKSFPPVNTDPDQYINLFPIHPFVIRIFNELPYFEKRGAIQFAMERVKKILDCEFPRFITYDDVFNEINAKHNIRHLDEVIPIIQAVETLESKIYQIDSDKQEDAKKLIKALGILKLYGKTNNNGAIPEELANQLLITSKTIKSSDRILQILNKIRQQTDGQFITKTNDNYFYLNLQQTIDYDEVIKRKMNNLPDGSEETELLKILKYNDLIETSDPQTNTRVFLDTAVWQDKKSFRLGNFIFDDNSDQVKKGDLDFNLIIISPYKTSKFSSSKNTALLPIPYTEEIDEILKKLSAINLYIFEKYAKTVMEKKYNELRRKAKETILASLLESELEIDQNKKRVSLILAEEPENINEFFYYLKKRLFNDYFTSKYNKYPKFLNQISYDNIKGEVENTLKELFNKGEYKLTSNAKSILSAMELIDVKGNLDIENSILSKIILESIKDKKNAKIEDIIDKLKKEPFGLNKEIVYLLISILTYSGHINLVKRGGGTITSSDLQIILRSGLDAFKDIIYANIDSDFPIQEVTKLFSALDLDTSSIRNTKDRTRAVQQFFTRAKDINDTIIYIKNRLNDLSVDPLFLDTSLLSNKITGFPIDKFLKVRTVNDFKNTIYNNNEISSIEEKYSIITNIKDLLEDNTIYKDYRYMSESIKFLNDHQSYFTDIEPLKTLSQDIKEITSDISKLLDPEQRRILKGKLQQYKRKYIQVYTQSHSINVGKSIKWNDLEKLNQCSELLRLRDMKAIKIINPMELNKLDDKILSLINTKCTKLQDLHMEDNYKCRFCNFPEHLKSKNINSEIKDLKNSLEGISDEWTRTILDNIESFKDNINLLNQEERSTIEDIIKYKELPSTIHQKLIDALNSLFSELKEIQITPSEIVKFIFSDSKVLDYNTFSKKLDEYKDLLCNTDINNIRIKIKED